MQASTLDLPRWPIMIFVCVSIDCQDRAIIFFTYLSKSDKSTYHLYIMNEHSHTLSGDNQGP